MKDQPTTAKTDNDCFWGIVILFLAESLCEVIEEFSGARIYIICVFIPDSLTISIYDSVWSKDETLDVCDQENTK